MFLLPVSQQCLANINSDNIPNQITHSPHRTETCMDRNPRTVNTNISLWCASGCVVECQTCNWEVAGSNLGWGYFAPRPAQPSIPPGSVNEYQSELGRQRQVRLIPIVDECVGVQVKL